MDYAKKFTPIKNDALKITLLMSKENSCTTNHIARYLVKMGIDVDTITAVTKIEQIPENSTHLIAYENKLEGDVFVYVKQKKIKLLVVEENFLSLDENNLDGASLISKYSEMGETLYTFLNENKRPKVLIVEDDKVTITLLNIILEDEYCQVDIAYDGQEGLELLKSALSSNVPYDIVYTDQNMPILSGEDMVRLYKFIEKNETNHKPTNVVSISGDGVGKTSKHLFDVLANKPFNKEEILSAFIDAVKN